VYAFIGWFASAVPHERRVLNAQTCWNEPDDGDIVAFGKPEGTLGYGASQPHRQDPWHRIIRDRSDDCKPHEGNTRVIAQTGPVRLMTGQLSYWKVNLRLRSSLKYHGGCSPGRSKDILKWILEFALAILALAQRSCIGDG